jgi:hypothetical protein
MPVAQRLRVDDALSDEVRSYAAEVGMDPQVVADSALQAGLYSLQRFGFFKPRDPHYDTAEARRILRSAPDVPPEPGDELPEGWKPLA